MLTIFMVYFWQGIQIMVNYLRDVNGRIVNEEIVAAALGQDESVALGIVEPLHRSRRHGHPPRMCRTGCLDTAALQALWRGLS